MTDLDTVLLDSGLAGITFGCSSGIVLRMLGEPDSHETDDEGDEILEYEELGLTVTFWADFHDGLGFIGTERPSARLLGRQLVGQTEELVKTFIKNEIGAAITEEDGCVHEDGCVQIWIEVDSRHITFWFHDGQLYLIEWSCKWVGDSPAWYAPVEV